MVPLRDAARFLALAGALCLVGTGCRTISPSVTASLPGATTTFPHDDFDRVLRRFVDAEGRVDYAGLKESSEDLDRYFALIGRYSPDSHPELFPTEPSRLAYWINAYNAAAMETVLRHYPISSVTDVGPPTLLFFLPDLAGFFVFRRIEFGGESMSLRHLENDVIRERFTDPRFHFALNCASASCPRLPARAFSAERLDEELEREARSFIGEERNVRVDHDERVVHLSEIFGWYESDYVDWYAEAFPDREASILAYVSRYLSEADAEKLAAGPTEYEVRYIPYDWSLNDQRQPTDVVTSKGNG